MEMPCSQSVFQMEQKSKLKLSLFIPFVVLKQGGQLVEEYEAEFSSLSRYAPHLVTDPAIRRYQFQKGFDKYIRLALVDRALTTHDTVLDVAHEIESVQKEPKDPHVVQSRTPVSPAQNVERPLRGSSRLRRGSSFLSISHILRPTPIGTSLGILSRSAASILVYATHVDSPTMSVRTVRSGSRPTCPHLQLSTNPILEQGLFLYNSRFIWKCEGKVLVSFVPTLSLFDSRASHCFLSRQFESTHSLPITPLTTGWNINTGSGVLVASSGYEACPVVISGRDLFADFLVIDLPSFDVVFGMDWLGSFFATIDFYRRCIVFEIPDHPRFEFLNGSTLAGPIEYKAKLKKATFAAMQVEPEKLIVVREFEDVFLDDIYGLLLDRAVEFSIELKPVTAPISKTPFRMPLAELAELQTQLDDLM
ncbi:uncharacterized protein LOC109835681 [Asparagus officinalis]|uniref:uncharacterized protein LOC109835681 n=1 Tax=Asparagus officinalis TaxID=4686 RepID=UPI00098DFEED|nr:uncharacterized protein LOC109835681 [Asparagus officinalis]